MTATKVYCNRMRNFRGNSPWEPPKKQKQSWIKSRKHYYGGSRMVDAVKKQYVGRAIEKTFKGSNGDFTVLRVSFGQKDLDAMQKRAHENNGWVNLNINKKMNPPTEENPSTHSISIDTWKKGDK